MLFNSIDFAIFLPVVFLLYWFVTKKNLKLQNLLIVIASYVFYGFWDWRFLSLIIFSTLIDYLVGARLSNEENTSKRKILLCISIAFNLGLLGFFKYYNFFLENLITAFTFFGNTISIEGLNIVLPVGISFYTFQTLSYTIDIYKRKLEPTKDFIAFSAFISFFPQLVAGPIERATNLLPQFHKKRVFEYDKAVDGLRQILWGLFKKVVIADNSAKIANEIFSNSNDYSGSTLLFGALFFTFQIYCDFSGYSDIAIGTSRLFGFNLKQNFAFPYFSRDIAEFWRRWHISLSTWFRDYLYIPLGGSRGGTRLKIRNILVIFVVSGVWHGANWTFVVWGVLNALFFLPILLTNSHRKNLNTVAQDKLLPSLKELFQMLLTFGLTVIGWIFFRAENVDHAVSYLSGIFSFTLFYLPNFERTSNLFVLQTTFLILLFLLIEWKGRERKFAIEVNPFKQLNRRAFRWLFYLLIGLIIFIFGNFNKTEFIYFTF